MKIGDYESHEAADIFALMPADKLSALADDIRDNGLREPLWWVRGDDGGRLVLDGRNRILACAQAGAELDWREYTGDSPTAFVLSMNLHRRHLDPSQSAMAGARAKPLFEKEAARRRLASQNNDAARAVRANLRSLDPGKATAHAAKAVNVSPRSVESAAAVLRTGTPELVEAVDAGRVAVSVAAEVATAPHEEQRVIVAKGESEILAAASRIRAGRTEARRSERLEKLATIATGNAVLDASLGTFPVLYADPPWRYEHAASESRAIENQYPTMELDAICALPVSQVTTPDAILFLWATSPKLEEAMRVVREWGFIYRTNMVWDKGKIGMGYYFRQQHELLLVATKGSIPAPAPENRPPSVYRSGPDERLDHSEKPAWFAEMIERQYPGLPKLEMFCRSPRPGWRAWGNQSAEAAE